MASNHLQIILSIQDSWWKKVDRTSLFSISGSWLGLDWGIRSKLLPVALPLRLMFNWVVQSSTDRWPNFTWNDGGATGERKRFLQLCLCCSTSTRQICNMGDISASCTARDWQKLRSCNHCAFVWVCRMCLEALYVIYMWYIYIYGISDPDVQDFPMKDWRFRYLMETVYKTTQWFVNRPNIAKLREADEKFYVTWWTASENIPGSSSVSCSRAWPGGKYDHLHSFTTYWL